MNSQTDLKASVREFWNERSCGEIYASGGGLEQAYYESHRIERYGLEPYITGFAKFYEGTNKDVLEIGVGMGADHIEWAKSYPKSLVGIDLTPRAVEHTKRRLALFGFNSDVIVADAEYLPFENGSFDLVYSWGVLHHSPDTRRCIHEVLRVLRPGGMARVMIYHKYSLTGYMLWIRYALLTGHPFRSLSNIYAEHMESPGTKAYSVKKGKALFESFSEVNLKKQLSFSDLLEGEVGQKHRSALLTMARMFYPRSVVKRLFGDHGLILFVEAIR